MRSTYANRGGALEELVTYTNSQYKQKGIAIINKIPTPTTIKKDGTGFFKAKSTVDFTGTLTGGRFICFDAKETKQPNLFPLANIHQHQIDYMQSVTDIGGIAFVIVRFSSFKGGGEKFFRLMFEELAGYWKRYQTGGGKRGTASIPAKEFKDEITGSEGYALHYLKGVV